MFATRCNLKGSFGCVFTTAVWVHYATLRPRALNCGSQVGLGFGQWLHPPIQVQLCTILLVHRTWHRPPLFVLRGAASAAAHMHTRPMKTRVLVTYGCNTSHIPFPVIKTKTRTAHFPSLRLKPVRPYVWNGTSESRDYSSDGSACTK